jgi:hypothetical protein
MSELTKRLLEIADFLEGLTKVYRVESGQQMMTLRDDAKALRKAAALLHEEREPTSEDALLLYLQGKPLANGDWPHLLWCSGDRSKPPGSRGVTCCCKPPVPEEREPVMVYDRCGNLNLVRLTDE